MARNRTFSIINGTSSDMIIGSVVLTGDAEFTLAPITLPLTIVAGDEYLVTATFDNTFASGLYSAVVTVTTQDLVYSEKTTLSSDEPVAADITLGLVTDSGLQGAVLTSTLSASGGFPPYNYTQDNPTPWITVASNGSVTATSDSFISGRWRPGITVTDSVGSKAFNDKLWLDVYKPHDVIINEESPSAVPLPEISVSASINTATRDGKGFEFKTVASANNEWQGFNLYYPNAGADGSGLQLVVLDGKDNTTTITDIPIDLHTSLNFIINADNGIGYFHTWTPNLSGAIIAKYDPSTKTLTSDVAPNIKDNLGAKFYKPQGLNPYDRKIYICGKDQSDDTMAHVMVFDPTTEIATTVGISASLTVGGADCHSLGSDATHVYFSVGRDPEWSIVAMNISDGTSVVLGTNPTAEFIVVSQLRYGVSASWGGVAYYLFNGVATPQANGIPWSPQDSSPDPELRTDKPDWDEINTSSPDGTGVCRAFMKYQGAPTWSEFVFTVDIYKDLLKSRCAFDSSNTLLTGRAYSGYSVVSKSTGLGVNYNGLGVSPCPAFKSSTNKVYVSGYPSGVFLEWDTSKAWTRTSIGYDPDVGAPAYEDQSHNPRFIQYTADICGIHKTRDLAEDSLGFINGVGVWLRDGDGGGWFWYDPNSVNTVGGLRTGFELDKLYQLVPVSNGSLLVSSSEGVSGDGKLFILDVATRSISRTTQPVTGRIDTFCGYLASFDNASPFVYGIATALDQASTDIYCVDATNGSTVWKHTMNGVKARHVELSHDDTVNLMASSDGYLYASLQTSNVPVMYRIDPVSGGIEVIGKTTNYARIDEVNGVFLLTNSDKSITDNTTYASIDNMPPVILEPASVADIFIDMETINGADFTNQGTSILADHSPRAVDDLKADWLITAGEMSNNLLQTNSNTGVGILYGPLAAENVSWSVTFEVGASAASVDQIAGFYNDFGQLDFRLIEGTANGTFDIKLDTTTTSVSGLANGLHHMCFILDRTAQTMSYSIDGGALVVVNQVIAATDIGPAFSIGNRIKGASRATFDAQTYAGYTKRVGGCRIYFDKVLLQAEVDADFAEAKAVYGVLLP